MAQSDVVVKVVFDGSGGYAGIQKLNDGLAKTGANAQAMGKQTSQALREARTGVVGIVNDLTGGFASKFMDVKDAIGGATVGLKGFKAALIGTGVGALVVAMGALVAYSDDLTEMFQSATIPAHDLRVELENQAAASAKALEAFELEARALRAVGVAEEEVLKQKQKRLEQARDAQEQLVAQMRLEALQMQAQQEVIKGTGWQGSIYGWLFGDKKQAEANEAIEQADQKLKELTVQTLENTKAIQDAEKKTADERKANAEARKKQIEDEINAEKRRIEQIGMQRIDGKSATIAAEIDQEKQLAATYVEIAETAESRRTANEFAASQRRMAQRQKEADFAIGTITTLQGIVDGFTGANERSQKRAFNVQKGLSAVQATIDTYKSINAIFASAAANPATVLFPGFPYVQAALAGAAGFLNVKKILSTQFTSSGSSSSGGSSPSFSGGGGGAGGGQASGVQAPSAAIDFSFLNKKTTQQPIQAYVLAGHVTNSQEAREKIENQARL